MTSTVSYANGPSEKALLGKPIPQMFDDIVLRFGEREAVVSLSLIHI